QVAEDRQVRQGEQRSLTVCVVKNKAGTEQHLIIDVVVHNSPVIEIFTPNGAALRSNRYSLYDTANKENCSFIEPKPDDQGTYTCEANKYGGGGHSHGAEAARPTKRRGERSTSAPASESGLFCDVVDGYPKAKISWRRNGVELEPGAETLAPACRRTARFSRLSIDRSALRRDRPAGVTQSWRRHSVQQRQRQPTADHLGWFKDGAPLTPDSRRLRHSERDGQELEIVSVGPESQGCPTGARLSTGPARDSAEVRLTVVEAPSIDESQSWYTTCAAAWTRSRLWSKRKRQNPALRTMANRVTILRSEVSDTAEYSCTAENRFGRISRSFNLMIMAGAPAANPALSTDGSRLSFSASGPATPTITLAARAQCRGQVSRYFKLVVITPPPALVEGSGLARSSRLTDSDETLMIISPTAETRSGAIPRASLSMSRVCLQETYQVIVQVAPRFPRDFIAGPETKSHRLNDAAERGLRPA
uniref:Ig-like domain-containing protein n=1 Tax=Macrostomum lignano TaxID=282301 RepID=A0A1I8FHW6_9PLAT